MAVDTETVVHLTTLSYIIVIIRMCVFVLPSQQRVLFLYDCFTCCYRPTKNITQHFMETLAKFQTIQSTG